MLVIGIDVGGTFTDVVCSDGANTWQAKAPTDPHQFGAGVLQGCELIAGQIGMEVTDMLPQVERFGLGTTAVTNVLATHQGQKVGLLTTSGFEDHLHVARGNRINNAGWLEVPWNPVERRDVVGINERVDRNGVVLVDPSEEEVALVASSLILDRKVEAIAISFLWSCRNPVNESKTAEIIRLRHPGVPVFSGAELHPLLREYERTTMAVLSAFTASALDGVSELESALYRLGLTVPLLLLHSGGGAVTVDEARKAPLSLASSGPAAGAVAAGQVAEVVGYSDALCCDMGGTSIDVGVVRDGVPERRQHTVINGIATGVSAIDVESIGAGGGSIAWIDSRGVLRVGPQSARALPGPVCYGRGGTQPTVTDAMVVLGYIDPSSFMGGAMTLDVNAAHRACADLGSTLGMTETEVACGIREIAIAEMNKAIRARLGTGGIDQRKFAIVSLGGSGSLFVLAMAHEIGFEAAITSPLASVMSGYGAAIADIRRDKVLAVDEILPASRNFDEEIRRMCEDLESQLTANGVSKGNREYVVEADLRLHRQKSTITLSIDGGRFDADALLTEFRTLYSDRYGPAALMTSTRVELACLRVVGIGRTVKAALPKEVEIVSQGTAPTADGSRRVWLNHDIQMNIPVYRAERLHVGHILQGPALIDSADTTVWLPAGMALEIGANRTYVAKATARED